MASLWCSNDVNAADKRWQEFRQIVTRSSGRRGGTSVSSASDRRAALHCTWMHYSAFSKDSEFSTVSHKVGLVHARQRHGANTAVKALECDAVCTVRSRHSLTIKRS